MTNNADPKDYKAIEDDIYKALCANHLTGAVADFLANMAVRVAKLEDAAHDK